MTEITTYIIDNIYQFLGVIMSIIYVILSIKENILCWIALILAAILNMYAYYLINLPLQSLMQIFFILTALYGWYNWSKKTKKEPLKISTWSLQKHLSWTIFGIISTILITGMLLTLNTNSALHSEYPFLDALMFVFNIIPMYMTGKKILESWLYFIIIDVISGVFYGLTGEYFFCFLFICYIFFATKGYLTWRKQIV
ncbi:MAG: hypothetical protein CMD26_06220 [Flavobacteriales bacterium]|nr:hypothetical protein [Flavobacteriales bacterium]|tara:strand:+ start:2974 stop:3567 length:594 start_codon:yes stop_codon:yes gene_type:complete